MHTCEWDMLCPEGRAFAERLEGECGKKVGYWMVKGVPHGWDKAARPWAMPERAKEVYGQACAELRLVLGE